jgi:hypothetical protein
MSDQDPLISILHGPFALLAICIATLIIERSGLPSDQINIIEIAVVTGIIVYIFIYYRRAQMVEFFLMRKYYNDTFEAYLKNIIVEEEVIKVTLKNLRKKPWPESEAIFDRIITVRNLSKKNITELHMPCYYSVYSMYRKSDYELKRIQITKVYDQIGDYYIETEILKDMVDRDNEQISNVDQTIQVKYPGDGTLITGWIKVAPIILKPNKSMKIRIRYSQNHIFDNWETQEHAGATIFAPTRKLIIETTVEKGYKIESPDSPAADYDIKNLATNYQVHNLNYNRPDFSSYDRAQWTIDKPILGNKYSLVFKVREVP